MNKVIVQVPTWYSDYAKDMTPKVVARLANKVCKQVELADGLLIVVEVDDDAKAMFEYLSTVDALVVMNDASVSEVCPDLLKDL